MTSDPTTETSSVLDNIVQMGVRVVVALAVLGAMIYLVTTQPENYIMGLVTGTLAPILMLAMKRIYDVA